MAGIEIRTQRPTRVELARIFPDPRLLQAVESLFSDVVVTIPEAIDQQAQDITAVEAAAAAAQTDATAALDNAAAVLLYAQALAQLVATPLPLTDAPSIAVDATYYRLFTVTLGGNRTLAAPTGLVDGAILHFDVRQDATGGRTLAFASIYDFGGAGAPTLNPAPNAADYFFGYYDAAAGKILCIARKPVADPLKARFSAHNNGSAQSIPAATWTKVTLGTKAYDVGAAFASSTWTPPAGVVQMCGAVSIVLTAAATVAVSVYKNGAEYRRGAAVQVPAAGEVTVPVACEDQASGTDTYELWVRQSGAVSQSTNGAQAATWFQGSVLAP